jgi:HEAT repeat protein
VGIVPSETGQEDEDVLEDIPDGIIEMVVRIKEHREDFRKQVEDEKNENSNDESPALEGIDIAILEVKQSVADGNPKSSENQQILLESCSDLRAIEMFMDVFDKSWPVYYPLTLQRLAISALKKSNDERVWESLCKALGYRDREIGFEAAGALGDIGDNRAVDCLIRAFLDNQMDNQSLKDRRLRQRIAGALGKIGDERAVEPLIGSLGERVELMGGGLGDYFFIEGYTSAWALGQIGDERAVEPLIELLNNPEIRPNLKDQVASALGEIGDERAVEPLIDALATFRSESNERAAVAFALGKIGDERAVEPLIEAFGERAGDRLSTDAFVFRNALVMLGISIPID